eukprot:2040917-Prymnesium_polylepis.1
MYFGMFGRVLFHSGTRVNVAPHLVWIRIRTESRATGPTLTQRGRDHWRTQAQPGGRLRELS